MATATQRIALASLKGGCGKSTLALNLAAGLAQRHRVALLDADPQGALRHWSAWGQAHPGLPEVFDASDDPLAVMHEALQQFPLVVVDCPPTLDPAITGRILTQVDTVLIPILPSALDLWAGSSTVTAVTHIQASHPHLKAWLLLNQVEPRSALSRAMTQALSGLSIPTLPAHVHRRAAFRQAAVEGTSIYQLGARGRAAVADIDQVIHEALSL